LFAHQWLRQIELFLFVWHDIRERTSRSWHDIWERTSHEQ
jgi:hypothetical protein